MSTQLAPAPGQPRLGIPRVLVATPTIESKMYAFEAWCDALRAQETELLWDLALLDNTDDPSPSYLEELYRWSRSRPFGPRHRVRLLPRFGVQANSLTFRHPLHKVQYAERALWGKFAAWSSYDYLLSLEIDVLMPPDGLQKLYEATVPWAAAWMVSRVMRHPSEPNREKVVPLIFPGLTHDVYVKARCWEDVEAVGLFEPPASEEPFEVAVTHLGCTLLRGDLVRSVPFTLSTAGGDVNYAWRARAAGFPVMCVPAVRCDHVAEHEVEKEAAWLPQ